MAYSGLWMTESVVKSVTTSIVLMHKVWSHF